MRVSQRVDDVSQYECRRQYFAFVLGIIVRALGHPHNIWSTHHIDMRVLQCVDEEPGPVQLYTTEYRI